jgi:hypothetical protein
MGDSGVVIRVFAAGAATAAMASFPLAAPIPLVFRFPFGSAATISRARLDHRPRIPLSRRTKETSTVR